MNNVWFPLAAILLLASCEDVTRFLNPTPAPNPDTSADDVNVEYERLLPLYLSGEAAQAVQHDLVLPVTLGRGVTAFWNSDNPAVISRDGVVSRPHTGGDVPVTLTATLTKRSVRRDKVFLLRVIALAPVLDATAPAEVTGVQVVAGDGTLDLFWTDPPDADLALVTATSPGVSGVGAAAGVQTITLAGLVNERDYPVTLRTEDKSGNRSAGVVVVGRPQGPDPVPPSEVSHLSAQGGESQVTLTWADPPEPDFVEVEISGGGFSTVVVPRGAGRRVVTGLVDGVTYTFVLRTKDSSGNRSLGVSTQAAPRDLTPPSEVSNLTSDAGNGTLTLTWTNPVDGDLAQVEIAGIGAWPATPGATMSRTITGLVNSVAYTWSVRTVDTAGNASPWSTVSGTPYDATVGGGNVTLVAQLPNGLTLVPSTTQASVSVGALVSFNVSSNLPLDSAQWYQNGALLADQASVGLNLSTTGWTPGTYQLTLVARSGAQIASVSFALTVTP